jgi:multiple sugar transport system permease protein
LKQLKTKTNQENNSVPLKTKPLKLRMRPWLILLPSLIVLMGILIPFITAILYSFTDISFRSSAVHFVGLTNWIDMFTSKDFWHAVLVTFEYGILATVLEMLIGVIIALTLNNDHLYAKILNVVLIFPLMVAPVIGCLMWNLMTNNTFGLMEKFLNLFGVYSFPWGASSKTALLYVIIIDIWINTPFVLLLARAGLQGLPKSPYEAAQIDGGSAWFTFRRLTLPLLKPVLLIALIFRIVAALQEFAIIYSTTKGGPGNTLTNLSLYAYQTAFPYSSLGKAIPYIMVLWMIINLISKKLVAMYNNSRE